MDPKIIKKIINSITLHLYHSSETLKSQNGFNLVIGSTLFYLLNSLLINYCLKFILKVENLRKYTRWSYKNQFYLTLWRMKPQLAELLSKMNVDNKTETTNMIFHFHIQILIVKTINMNRKKILIIVIMKILVFRPKKKIDFCTLS